MVARLAFIACLLCMLSTAVSAKTEPAGTNLCRQQMSTAQQLWQHDLYDAPPAAAAVMVDAIEGRLSRVRHGLAALPSDQQANWRQLAMLTAAWSHQPTVVDGLLDDGAAVDARAWLPPRQACFLQPDARRHGQGPAL